MVKALLAARRKAGRAPKRTAAAKAGARGPQLLYAKGSIRKALADLVRGLPVTSKAAAVAMHAIPDERRAGYPLVRARGSIQPKAWKTGYGTGVPVVVDLTRRPWLPDDWCQGVKRTKGGNTYTVYMPPTEMRTLYHQWQIEEYLGRQLTTADGFKGQLRLAALQQEQRPLAPESSFFKLLSRAERAHLVGKDAFHFCVVSARRAQIPEGARDIASVQMAFLSQGVEPTWYVDEGSLEAYRALGLRSVAGGRLTPSRNMALADARKMGKPCVQCSDDLSCWEYRVGEAARGKTMEALNAAHAASRRYAISPVTAARFILAKMRGVAEGEPPRLGGAYVLSDCSRTWATNEFARKNFILGDFFVDDNSGLVFDERLTLKEDFDFCAQHLHAYGSVMRCNRMCFFAKHYSNAGGAVANRDAKGAKEQENMAVLYRKWPGAIFPHKRRKNEVRLAWPADGKAKEPRSAKKGQQECSEASDEEPETSGPGKRKRPDAPTDAPTGGPSEQRGDDAEAKSVKGGWPSGAVIRRTSKASPAGHVVTRCNKVAGLTVGKALAALEVPDARGELRAYSITDLRYDLSRGYVALATGGGNS